MTERPQARRDGRVPASVRMVIRGTIALFLLVLALALPAAASADPGDLGYEGPSGTGAGAAPTGSKPEAKAWFNDGSWWASMWDVGTTDFYIWKLDNATQTWSRTATRLDDRNATRADVLWDGTKLYVASHNFSESSGSGQSRLYRYSYNASSDTYTIDAGFPAVINSVRSETLVIEKDSTGKLWAVWNQNGQVWVNRTTTSDSAWGTPFVLPGSTNVSSDDIATIIAFGGNKIGVLWSNQSGSPDADHFSIHTDGQADTTWAAPETAYAGANVADDHLNLKTDSSGRVYAVVKTSLSGSSPLISFLKRETNGTWTNHVVGRGSDDHTRPILIVDEAHGLFRVYMTLDSSGGPIVEKTSAMGSIAFPVGDGTPVIWDASSDDMNNPTSTKQNATSQTGLVVLAYEDTQQRYWHATIFAPGGGGSDTTPPTVTTRDPAPGATAVSVSTNVTATFSEPVTGVSGATFTLEGPGATPVTATVTYDGPTRTATLDPSAALLANTTYTARLLAGITDTAPAANALTPLSWTFTTAPVDTTPPTVTTRDPAPGATAVSVSTNVTATFSEPVTGVSGATFTLEGPGATPVTATVTYDGPTRTATLDPSAALLANTTYTARLLAGITDTAPAANALTPLNWTFTTGSTPTGAVFRSASSGANTTTTSLVLPRPSGVAADDVLLAVVSLRGNGNITAPAGWSSVRQDNNGNTIRQAIFVRVAGASEPATYTFAFNKAQSATGGIVAYSGADTTTPIGGHSGQANASSTGITAPSLTTTGPDRVLVGFFGTAVLTTETPPAGMTERFDQPVPAANQYKVTVGSADQLLTSTGATGTRIAVAANAGINVGQLVALNPGVTAPPPVDTTPPTVTARTPGVDATDVAIGTNVTATFSEPVTGVSGATVTLEGPGATPVSATVTYDAPTRTATLDPSSDLAHGTTYTARLLAGITDTAPAPNALVPLSWTFTTVAAPPVDTTPPTVTARTPGVDATDVAIGTNVTATFSEPVTGVSGATVTLEGPGATPVSATVTYDAPTRTATLDPSSDLAHGTTYTARLLAGITDTAPAPNALVPLSWTFTTVAAPPVDTTPPTVTARTPGVDATDVAIGTNVTATFSEPVTGVSGATVTLEGPGATPVSATVTYDAPTRTATLDPSSDLAHGTTYTARLLAGITDTAPAPNALVPLSWTFTTVAAPPPSSGIAFRSASSGSNTTATTLVIPAPAGVLSDDVLIAAVAVRGNPTVTAPAGWTLVRGDLNGNTIRQFVYVRVAGSSEPASYTFTFSGAQSAAGGIVAYDGVDTSSPVDVHGGQVNASSTSITAPSVTTTGTGRYLLGLFATASLTTATPPSGMTERYDQQVPAPNQYKVTVEAAEQALTAAGATGSRVAVAANAGANVGQLVALRPAP